MFSQVTSDRMRGNGQKLYQGRVRFDIRENFFTKRGAKLEQPALGSGGIIALKEFDGDMAEWWAWQSWVNNWT